MGMGANGRVMGGVAVGGPRGLLQGAQGAPMGMRVPAAAAAAAAAVSPLSSSNSNPRAAGPWKEYFSAEGRPYYHNEITGITTWDKPLEFMQAPPPVPPAAAAAAYSNPHHQMNHFMQTNPQQNITDDAAGQGRDQSGPPGANIFVFHVPNEWNSMDLLSTFSQFGNILSARVAVDRQTGRNKGYGFVSFDAAEAAAAAVAAMNGFLAGGKRLKVTIKKGEEQHAVRASPAAAYSGAQSSSSGGSSTMALQQQQQQQAARDQQWGTSNAYNPQTPSSAYGAAGGFAAAAAPPQQQRFAPY
ncbi:hypothetical protein, conserved [Eimeria brunetti]|uniref:Uncharacterized protein n=1 Tax=Eimeria brunetti TaxID=51314 RepID=U6LR28_9EIME|nr:hypothetical protein, conserved [Eimeria brunetti]